MQSFNIVRQTRVQRTTRVMQLEGVFDLPAQEYSRSEWTISLFCDEKEWKIGLIIGPSGSGKTTLLYEAFGKYALIHEWQKDKSIVDCFPEHMSIKKIIELLSSVGFSSPPSWLRPFHVLSNGEQFRASLARSIAEAKDIVVIDEYSSVVDRTVAQITSAALAKTIRKSDKKLVCASCHYDIIEWLQPDWIYEPCFRISQRQRPGA